MPRPPYSLGIDTGGTFTDLVQIDAEGRLALDKSFSTPAAPEDAVFDVLGRLAERQQTSVSAMLGETGRFAHGTTVSTNALIQRRGARVGLLTTRGFEDTLLIARGPVGRAGGLPPAQAMDFLHTEPPPPLVPGRLTRGLGERITVTGEALAALNGDDVRAALGELLAEGVESLAVCLLWSFRNPAHERLVRDIATEMAPDLRVSLSSEIAPRLGEFERMVTTVVNAYVGPVTERYITALGDRLAAEGLAAPMQVMKSSGGAMLPRDVGRDAVSVVNSGPIGGLVAARHVGRALGHDNVITCDMGGTSFDVGLIARGVVEEDAAPFLAQGLPVLTPSVRMVTIGAGGGSIASTDGYRLHVGPASAGADPGPACYGRGGDAPTVTDALVALGIVDPEHFFGGRYALDAALAERALETRVGGRLGLDVTETAAGIYEVVTARMADLIRKVSIESGVDPREFRLFAYGGACGAHCAAFAAPVFSAYGAALCDVLYSHARSEPVGLSEADAPATVNRVFEDLEARALADMAESNVGAGEVTLDYRIDMRYRGQMNEVSLPWPAGRMDENAAAKLQSEFESHYQQRFGAGTTRSETPLELISYRVEAMRPTDKPALARLDGSAGGGRAPGNRKVYQRNTGWVEAEVLDYAGLEPGRTVPGPAVIERDNATIWLPPGSSGALDAYGNLEIEPGAAR